VVGYRRRIVDDELDELLGLPAVAIEGPKGVGKTATATQRAASVIELDDPGERDLLAADPKRLDRFPGPVLVDEWQRYPEVWDLVRRSVDRQPIAGRFLLTGSATPTEPPTHSGAGRIVRLRMRPMSLAERGLPDEPTVSLARMLDGPSSIEGAATLDLTAYTDEILASGFPAIRPLSARLRNAQLDGYLQRIVDAEFTELGHRVRRPTLLTAWMRAYAAATSTTAAYNTILDAATPGDADKPARSTTEAYRDVLSRLWILDPLPGWSPATHQLSRLASAPKHHLADPALAARLLAARREGLLTNDLTTPVGGRDGTLLGALFESLVALSVRTYAQAAEASVFHLRTKNGDHEIDLVVEGQDRRLVALEVKLSPRIFDNDVKHLHWLRERTGDLVADLAVITSGQHAYRRPDGIAVIPASLLGP
jgi:uncharacterized protein